MWIGDVLLGKFVIERPAGSGGMGTVFRAVDRETGAPVAVKVMDGEASGATRFFREAQLLAELNHPAIVRYLANGIADQGEPFLVMEWLQGGTLAERLDCGGLNVVDTVALGRRAAEGLAAAHSRGIVHRDVKPANLFLVGEDAAQTKLLDFGIARPVTAAWGLTRTGAVVGTVGYMAPEQARGESELDARVDVFALGCVLFECLAGQPAFAGRQVLAVLAKLVLEEVPSLSDLRPDVPEALSDLVARMLAKDRSLRPADGAAVAREIEAFVTPTGPAAAVGVQERPSALADADQRALTQIEQRVLTVILVDPRGAPAALTPTVRLGGGTQADVPISRALRRFGARLVPMVGGCVLANIPAGGGAKDQAWRAAGCALALSSALPGARIALATGRSETGYRLPIGTAIDRAAELLAASTAPSLDGVLIDDVTRALLDARFEVTICADGALLVADRGESDEVPLLLGKRMPCLGRDKELALLEATLRECVEEPMARAVLVTGVAGMGKTRLRQEFLARAGPGPGLVVLQARGDPFAAGSSHTLARQLVQRAAGLRDGQPVAEQQRKLRTAFTRCLDGETLKRTTEFLGEIVGIRPEYDDSSTGPSPQFCAARNDALIMREWLGRSFDEWLTAECAAHPMLIVLEDLHWGDATTVSYLGRALHSCGALPLMVLALARPEVTKEFPNLWPEAGRQDITLSGLTRRAATEFVRAALGNAPFEDVSRMVQRADGNAFYLEELIRARATGATALPETVLAMVEARLDALEPGTRRVLRAGSIFGEMFWAGAVASLVGGETGETTSLLEELVKREFVVRGRGDKFPGEAEYAFRHGLIREAAYAMLTDSDRRTGHRLAGQWLEQAGEKDARVLADHFELGGAAERAVPWLIQASRRAAKAGDPEAAVSLAHRGVSLGAEGETFGMLAGAIGAAETWRGRPDEGIRWLSKALTHLPEERPEWFAAAGLSLVNVAMAGDLPRIGEILPRMLGFSFTPQAHGPYGFAAHWSILALLHAGDKDSAIVLLDRYESAGAADGERDPAFAFWLRLSRGTVECFVHDSVGSLLSNTAAAVRLSGIVGPVAVAYARFTFGSALTMAGAFDEAAGELRSALEHARSFGAAWLVDLIRHYAAWTDVARGHGANTFATLQDLSEHRVAMMRGTAIATLAEARRQAGSLDEAELYARRALREAGQLALLQTTALAPLGAALLDQGRRREALDAANQGLRLCEAAALPNTRSALHRVRAEALWHLGDVEAARRAIGAARERILRIAAELNDPALRQSWIENAADNARTLQLACEWGVGNSPGDI